MGIKSLFGFGQARDKPVNERTAMQTTAVHACVRILAKAVASLPLHVYEYRKGYRNGRTDGCIQSKCSHSKNLQVEISERHLSGIAVAH